MLTFAGLVIVAAAVYLMVRQVEVRIVLLGAGLAMALLAGHPLSLADTFTRAMVSGMVAPICAAMGFATVLSATGCDRHFVQLVLGPVRRFKWLALPGGILAAYFVNMAIPSATSTAAALGSILVPLLLVGGWSPATAGAALVLGASFGGDLLNPGSQDIQTVAAMARLPAAALSAKIVPASALGALTAAAVFAALGRRIVVADAAPLAPGAPFETSYSKAVVPLIPVGLLLLGNAGVPFLAWLVEVPEGGEWRALANSLPVVRAMLVGTILAMAACWRDAPRLATTFFDGMGRAYGNIISLTITAQCFGAGIAAIGLADALLAHANGDGSLALLSGGFPWARATLSGSGSGAIATFAQTFLSQVDPTRGPETFGALACFGGAFGRTMSPVAAVVIYASTLVGVRPIELIRCFLPALLAGAAVAMSMVVLL